MMTEIGDKIEKAKILKEHMRNQASRLLLEPLLTTSDLQRLLKVDRRTVGRLVKRGELPVPMKLGGSNRWRAPSPRLSNRKGCAWTRATTSTRCAR